MKKVWDVLAMMVAAIFLLPITVYATEDSTPLVSGDYEYTLNENNEAIITSYNGSETILDIPASIDGSTVVEIGEYAFEYCDFVEVLMPDSIVKVGSWSFVGCYDLQSIKFSNSLEIIGDSAFCACKSLKKVHLPESVKIIEEDAFLGCESISNLILNSNLEKLGWRAFGECKALTSLEIPKDFPLISARLNEPFYNCDNLKTVIFQEGIKEINAGFHYNIKAMEVAVIPNTVTTLGDGSFQWCYNLKQVQLPETIETIGACAFAECSSLTELVIPESVTSIGHTVFRDCASLQKVILPNSCTEISENMFEGCAALKKIDVPENVTLINRFAFLNSGIETITLPNGLKTIDVSAFENCTALKSISLPDSLTLLQSRAFYGCEELADVYLGDGLSSIYDEVFYGCTSLERIVLSRRFEYIHDNAFSNCINLREIVIPRANCFMSNSGLDKLTQLTIYGIAGGSVEEWAKEANITFVPYEKHATSISLSETKLELDKWTSALLEVIIKPIDCTDEVEWFSSNPKVAAVYYDNYVYALGGGTTTITAKVGDLTATCEVTVIQEDIPVYVEINGQIGESTSFEIYDANGNKITSDNISGGGATYPLADLPAGTYTIKFSKENYVPRTYTIEVGTEEIQLEVELHKFGDITGDGVINARDKKTLFNHIAGTSKLTDYAFEVADVNGDGVINARDKKMVFNHIAGTNSLWK